ncbi:MAG TPA: molybdopterin converting factor subunit 1 [Tepidisphaeraceae bacterium]|jgi:molybdopterin converting factor subunit 1
MRVHVKLFAILRDRAGTGELSLHLHDGETVGGAVSALAQQHTSMADFLPRVAYAVNREYVNASTILHDGDELALIPPVSGGLDA